MIHNLPTHNRERNPYSNSNSNSNPNSNIDPNHTRTNSTSKTFFITSTDTNVGKTRITCDLIREIQAREISVMAYKPISCGCTMTEAGLRHDDALAFQHALNTTQAYEVINPWAFQAPISPNIAAQQTGVVLSAATLAEHCLQHPRAEVILIEGAGGWSVPLNEQETMADLAAALQAEVILVVGLRLGCLNHALLTVDHILQQSQLPLAGWVANQIDPDMAAIAENIATLQTRIPAPLLATVPYSVDPTPITWQYLPFRGLTNR